MKTKTPKCFNCGIESDDILFVQLTNKKMICADCVDTMSLILLKRKLEMTEK